MKKISYKFIIILIISIFIIRLFCICVSSSMAITSDYSLTDKTISLDGYNDGIVEISLISENGGNFYALDADWSLKEKESSSYFTLAKLSSNDNILPLENSASTGKVYWTDNSLSGFKVSKKEEIWTAEYKIDKNTPAGTYTIGLNVNAITGGTSGYDSDEIFSRTAIITVNREEPLPFIDIDSTRWYMPYVKYVYKNNLMTGYTATTFAPNNPITRGQIVTILYRKAGSPISTYEMNFNDIPASLSYKYYYEPVRWAAEHGIVTGYTSGVNSGKFKADDLITREQLAVILHRFAKYEGKNFTTQGEIIGYSDYNNISNYALNGMKWAVGVGIIKGNGNGTLVPQGNATRAETSAMIMRYCEDIN